MPPRIFTLYLSTLTPTGYNFNPFKLNENDTIDKSNVKWNIDWNRVFGDLCGRADCLVRIRLISKQSPVASLDYNSNLGTVRCNFSTSYQMMNNYVIVGTLNVVQFSGNINNALTCDTSMTEGVRIRVPNSLCAFNIQLIGLNEQRLSTANTPDYQIQFDFEIIEDSVQSIDT